MKYKKKKDLNLPYGFDLCNVKGNICSSSLKHPLLAASKILGFIQPFSRVSPKFLNFLFPAFLQSASWQLPGILPLDSSCWTQENTGRQSHSVINIFFFSKRRSPAIGVIATKHVSTCRAGNHILSNGDFRFVGLRGVLLASRVWNATELTSSSLFAKEPFHLLLARGPSLNSGGLKQLRANFGLRKPATEFGPGWFLISTVMKNNQLLFLRPGTATDYRKSSTCEHSWGQNLCC